MYQYLRPTSLCSWLTRSIHLCGHHTSTGLPSQLYSTGHCQLAYRYHGPYKHPRLGMTLMDSLQVKLSLGLSGPSSTHFLGLVQAVRSAIGLSASKLLPPDILCRQLWVSTTFRKQFSPNLLLPFQIADTHAGVPVYLRWDVTGDISRFFSGRGLGFLLHVSDHHLTLQGAR